jgi:hypothetical protein
MQQNTANVKTRAVKERELLRVLTGHVPENSITGSYIAGGHTLTDIR